MNKNEEMKIVRGELVELSRTVNGLEGMASTVVFLPPTDELVADPMEQQADSWRWAVKNRQAEELGPPTTFIGARLVGIMMEAFERGHTYHDQKDYGYLIKSGEIEAWIEMIEDGRHAVGRQATLNEQLNEVVVRRKGPRFSRGEQVEEDDRILLKVRPTLLMAPLWRSPLIWLKAHAMSCGGYVSDRQPPPPGIRKFRGQPNRRQQWD